MRTVTLLIVDDQPGVLTSLEMLLTSPDQKVITLRQPHQIPSYLGRHEIDAVILDMNFNSGLQTGNEGLFWLNRILEIDPDMPVVFITAFGDFDLAVKAIKQGAADFIVKPWENSKVIETMQMAVRLRHSKKKIRKQLGNTPPGPSDKLLPEFVEGPSLLHRQLMEMVQKVAVTDATILITGENGTGKEMLAREIHHRSPRSHRSMVGVDLAAVPEALIESELFGHVKGAYTDAQTDRTGKFELASGGTLFLDEIGNLSMQSQQKLLRVLQNREVVPVGSNRVIPVDIRLVCATNRDLSTAVSQHLFREDLFYRINTITLDIPPLRSRPEDIPQLANHFFHVYTIKYHKENLSISMAAVDKLMEFSWPGNIRELQHAMEKAVILADGDRLQPEDFTLTEISGPVLGRRKMTIAEMEKEMIREALKMNRGNISTAAVQLGITRQTLYHKIERYGL